MVSKIKKNGLSIFLATVVLIIFGGAAVVQLPVFILGLVYLVSEYYILLGGLFSWLGDLTDSDGFEETGVVYNLLAVDARLVLIFTILGIMVLVTGECAENTTVAILTNCATCLRLLLLGFIIHAIHTVVIYERVVGVRFIKYPPFCLLVKKIIVRLKEVRWYEQNKSSDNR